MTATKGNPFKGVSISLMIYDVLCSYEEYLLTAGRARETARTYLARLEILLQGQSLNLTAENLDIRKAMENLSEIKYKNYFSQSKNAFLHFCEFLNVALSDDDINQIETLEEKCKKKYRRLEVIEFKAIDKKIKAIRNKKLKTSYQTMLATGLRVSELAQIAKTNCQIRDDEIHFFFIGKGGNPESVIITKEEQPKLFDSLLELTATLTDNQKIFYSAVYLQDHAKKLGFKCHDLRRICSVLEYKKTKSKSEVKRKLRHSSIKNTNRYLRSKVNLNF